MTERHARGFAIVMILMALNYMVYREHSVYLGAVIAGVWCGMAAASLFYIVRNKLKESK